MINAYCNDSITLIKVTRGTWGSSTAEVSVPLRGRFEFRTKMVRDIKGETVVSTAKVFLATLAVTHADRISYGGKQYSILNIELKKDFSNQYLKLDLA